ncbi:MAG: tetratricopeptide repeat protein, partial [Endomicrobia bacterium]|nr:tetratricopeptide repeat protein [Endomicrobiia bacterium]
KKEMDVIAAASKGHSLDYYGTLGYIYLREKNYVAAQEVYEKLHELYPDNEPVINNLVLVYLATGDYAKALELARKAAELYPDKEEYKERCEEIERHVKNKI